MYFAT
jgi:hypothetical protein